MRKSAIVAMLLATFLSLAFAQSNVYVCPSPNTPGRHEYKNTGDTSGCKKVELFEPEIGMTSDAVINRLGKPLKVTYIKNRAGKTEQWFYEEGKMLTFKNGLLEEITQR